MIKFKTVDEYIESFPKEVQLVLQTIRQTIKEIVPNSEEKISYNLPAITLDDNYLIYFSGWKKHTSLYPYTEEMEKAFQETKDFKTSGKGTIQFPLDKPLPLDVIRKIVKFRIKEINDQ